MRRRHIFICPGYTGQGRTLPACPWLFVSSQSLTGGELLATFFPSGGGEADLPVPSAGVQLKPGVAMAIAVVISPLSISINGNIAWGEGGGGSGSGSVIL